MLVFLSTLFGLLSSAIPLILKYFIAIKTQNHSLANLDSKVNLFNKLQKYDNNLKFLHLLKYNGMTEALPAENSGFVYNLQMVIRPLITLFFCFLYVYIKYLCWKVVILHNPAAYTNLWTSDDAVMFSMIISFYFGSRIINYSI